MNREIIWPLAVDTWDGEEEEAAIAVIRSHRVTMGEKVAEFEAAFAKALGCEHAVMLNSGSSANLVAIAAMVERGILKRGDTVLVPAIAWATTYAPLHQYGLKIELVDVDLDTLNAPVRKYQEALDAHSDAKLLIGVSVLGNPADVDEIAELANDQGIYFMEDNCESLGAQLQRKEGEPFRPTGTFGLMNTHSFYFSHHLSTGEGGMLTTDDGGLAEYARIIRAHGWTRDAPSRREQERSLRQGFDRPYSFVMPGYNLRPLEVSAAIGLAQMKKQAPFTLARMENAKRLTRTFEDVSGVRLTQCNPRGQWSPFGFPMIFGSSEERYAAAKLLQAHGIECRMVTGGNIALHPVGRAYEIQGAFTPIADRVHECGLFVGNSPMLISEERFALLRSIIEKAVS